MWDEHISRLSSRAGEEGSPLFAGSQAGSNSSVKKLVSEPVVPGNSLTMPGTIEGMVSQAVTGSAACRARAVSGVDRVTEAISEGGDKLLRPKKES